MKRPFFVFTLFLAAAISAWFWPSIFGGKVLLPLEIMAANPPHTPQAEPVHNHLIGDMIFESYQWKVAQQRALAERQLPLWNPYTFCGHPLYTTGQSMTFYPLNLLFFAMPLAQAFVFFTAVHLLLGGLFTYLLFRRFGVGPFGAAVGGTVFAMCGLFVTRIVFPMFLGSGIWLPLMILWLDVAAEAGAFRRRPWLVLVGPPLFAMPMLAGFFEVAFYAYIACGLFTLVKFLKMLVTRHPLEDGTAFLGKALMGVTLAAVLTAPQLLPFFEVVNRNVRAGEGSFESAKASAMTGREMLTTIIPDVLGNPTRHTALDLTAREWKEIKTPGGDNHHYFGPKNYVEVGFYFGILPALFLLLGLIAPGRQRLFFWLLLAIAIAFAFVTPIYKVFLALVPGAEQVRTPFRWLYLAIFAGTYLAAIGADRWYARLREPGRSTGKALGGFFTIAALLLCIGVAVLYFVPAPLQSLAERVMGADERARSNYAAPGELAGLLWTNGVRLAGLLAVSLLILTLGVWRSWSPRAAGLLASAALVLIVLDLGQATFPFNTQSDPAILHQQPPIVAKMQEDKDVFRIGRFGWQKFMYPNLPTHYGLQDFGGYDSIILKDFAQYLKAMEPLKLLPYNIIMSFEHKTSLDSPLFQLLNIRYMVAMKPFDHPNWEKVPVEGELHLYRAKRELPRAFMVNSTEFGSGEQAIEKLRSGGIDITRTAVVQQLGPAERVSAEASAEPGTARIVEYTPSQVRIETRADSRQLLVLCDTWYPGWNAYIDGQAAPSYIANAVFRGVSVPAGAHVVEYRFEPPPFRRGLVALALGGVVMILTTGVFLVKGRREGPPAPRVRPTRQPSQVVDETRAPGNNAPA